MHPIPPLLLVSAVAVAAPFLTSHTRSLRIPIVVFEIALGVLIGPQVLGWARFEEGLPYLSTMGMAFLFFLAGMEIDLTAMRGPVLRLASASWLLSLGLSLLLAFGLFLLGGTSEWLLIAVALSTTALGIVVPVLRDAELLDTELGKFSIACGAMGEIGPILLMSLLLSHEHGMGVQLGLVFAFVLVVIGVFWASIRARPPGVIGLLTRTMTQSGQLPIRLSILLVVALVVLAESFGLDLALGAFAAGMAVGLAARDSHNSVLHHKFDAIGFGFLVPIFFICSGLQLDARALFESRINLVMMLVYAGLLLLVRGVPALIFRRHLATAELGSLGFYSATSLSLIVAITGSAVRAGSMERDSAAALVGGGLLSVLIFPVLGTSLAGRGRELRRAPPTNEAAY